jgi:hypothetical protein
VVLGWTVLKSNRDMKRFERENFISYKYAPRTYPCLARAELNADENPQTITLELNELETLSAALKAANAKVRHSHWQPHSRLQPQCCAV